MEGLTKDTEDFLKEVGRRSGMSLAEAKYYWEAVCSSALDHLGKEHKSIQLGFADIHPSPYRANWKNYLLARLPALGKWLHGANQATRNRILMDSLFYQEMNVEELMAVKRGIAYFNLEIKPNRSWWANNVRHQKKMLDLLGPAKYLHYIGKTIARLKERLSSVYFSHLAQIDLPCGRVYASYFAGGDQRLGSHVPRGRVRPSSVDVRLSPLVVRKTSVVPESTVEPEDAATTNGERVLPVPDIQPEAEDLRDPESEQ